MNARTRAPRLHPPVRPPKVAAVLRRSLPACLAVGLVACLAACRKSSPPPDAPEGGPASPSPLAGFEAQSIDDPVAKEGETLANGPLVERAAADAPGMQIDGDLIAGTLKPGEIVEQEFKLQPGRCYTLIAVGGEGVEELDASFETIEPVRGKASALIADKLSGNVAVVGAGEACFARKVEDAPLSVRWVLRVRGGSGVVVTQLYSR